MNNLEDAKNVIINVINVQTKIFNHANNVCNLFIIGGLTFLKIILHVLEKMFQIVMSILHIMLLIVTYANRVII
jgi:hypothetical protein